MTQQLLIGLCIIVDVIGLGALLYLLPRGNRKDLFFAVTVDPEFSSSAAAMALNQSYRRSIIVQSIAWLILSLLAMAYVTTLPVFRGTVMLIWLLPITVVGQVAGGMIAYITRRQQVLPFSVSPGSKRSALLSPSGNRDSNISMGLLLGPLLLIIVSALVLWGLWDTIPERYPSHWGLDGNVDGWATRSIINVGAPLLIALPITIILLLVAITIPFSSRRLYATGEAAGFELRARQITSKAMIYISYLVVIPLCLPAIILTLFSQIRNLSIILIIATIVLEITMLTLVIIAFIRSAAQMENARAAAVAAGETIIGDRTNDRFWTWGVFYYNPDDAAVWVDKRIGYGWTVNMARWQAYAGIIGLVVLPLVVVFWCILA